MDTKERIVAKAVSVYDFVQAESLRIAKQAERRMIDLLPEESCNRVADALGEPLERNHANIGLLLQWGIC